MEQKMKQKRLQSGMIQASDLRSTSGRMRPNGANKRELHGEAVLLISGGKVASDGGF